MAFRLWVCLIHMLGSLMVVGIVILAVSLTWYPWPLQKATGAPHIIFLIALVNFIIGPLATLIISKKNKKNLRYDLFVIVLIQLSAFGYGIWTLAQGRPVWLVFNVDRFDLVQAYEVDYRRANKIRPEYVHPPWTGPEWVAAQTPSDMEARNTLTFESVISGVDLPQRPDLYVPMDNLRNVIKKRARPLEKLNQFNPASQVREVLSQWPAANAYLPLNAKVESMSVLLKKETGEMVTIVDLRPWK